MREAVPSTPPVIDLRQLLTLTDDTGILQHSTFATPNPFHGYCTDDNSRALIACSIYEHLRQRLPGSGVAVLPEGGGDILQLLQRYLAFLLYAFDPGTRRFRNFMGFDRQWLEEVGSEDSHARAIWGLGVAFSLASNDSVKGMADRLLQDALPVLRSFRSLRPWAYGIAGLDEYLKVAPDDGPAAQLHGELLGRLHEEWLRHRTPEWPWWEDVLSWGNATLPNALIVGGMRLGRQEIVEDGLTALDWLLKVQTADEGHVTIIGNRGWYERGGKRARFDQQPLEAHGMVHACLAAARITREKRWEDASGRAFDWFLGRNDLGRPLYDGQTGGCHDGLMPDGVNANQGAESTLAYLLSVLELHERRLTRKPDAS